MRYVFFYFTILQCYLSFGESQNVSYTYNAAVVEYEPFLNYSVSPKERLLINTRKYISIIQNKTREQPLDIIIFPEDTLNNDNTALEIPTVDTVLCNSTNHFSDVLKNLSCTAIQYGTCIVVNIVEKQNCTTEKSSESCKNNDFIRYNTNIVFGSNGSLISRYRKYNLFGEFSRTKPTEVDVQTFYIRNSTFAMFTCFDIQFGVPALNLTKKMAVKNIIFPANWFSELPYLTALQVQQMWAQEFNVNLLAAGANNPRLGSGGSGMYIGNNGPLQYDILANGGTSTMFQKVPIPEIENNPSKLVPNVQDTIEEIDEKAKSLDGFYLLVDPSMKDHNDTTVNPNQTEIIEKVCHGETSIICCKFNISLSVDRSNSTTKNSKYYVYKLVAFNGIRTYSGLKYGGVETCGIVACLNESLNSCGQRFSNYSVISWPITFNRINITANFTSDEARVQFPNSLLSSLRPIQPKFTSWRKEERNKTVIRTHVLFQPQNRLLTFGIFGRDFRRDSDPVPSGNNTGNNSGNISKYDGTVIIFSLVCYYLFT